MDIFLRCDAGSSIGAGHLIRCLALGQDAVERGHGVELFMEKGLSMADEVGTTEAINLRKIDSEEEFSRRCFKDSPEWVVLDGYHFSTRLERELRRSARVLTIDDFAHREEYDSTLLLNQNLSAQESWYMNKGLNQSQLLLGARYVLLREEFKQARTDAPSNDGESCDLLVTLGGGDQDEALVKVLTALDTLASEFGQIHVLHEPNLNRKVPRNLTFHSYVDDMAGLMKTVNLALSGGGSTIWELAFLGVPTLALILEKNQEAMVEVAEERGILRSLGWYDTVRPEEITHQVRELIEDPSVRDSMTRTGRELFDGQGSARVLNSLEERLD